MTRAGRGLPKSPWSAILTKSPRRMSLTCPAVDIGQCGVHERLQIRVRPVGRGDQARLAAALLREAGTPGVGDPDLNGPQARLPKRRAPLANTFYGRRRHIALQS